MNKRSLPWMTDRKIYSSYYHASDKEHQLRILAELNGCNIPEIEEAIERYSQYISDRDYEYRKMLERIADLRQTSADISQAYLSNKRSVHVMLNRNPEPVSGVQSGIIKVKNVQKNNSTKDTVLKTKGARGEDASLRWRKKTTITNDRDIDWNSWIDSMRMHLEMAKECERQLKRLEKTYGSHRRKRGNIND